MFGVTLNGNSVMCHIHSFLSYFYVEIIDDSVTVENLTETDLSEFKDYLNEILSPGHNKVEGVSKIELHKKSSIMNFQAEDTNFLKIYVNMPKYLSQLRTLFEKETVLYQK